MGEKRSRRVPMALLAAGIVAVLGLTACTSSGDEDAATNGKPDSTQSPSGQAAPKPPAKITVEPASGAADVSPSAPIRVTVADGTIQQLTLTNQTGKQVAGNLSPDGTTWTLGEPLGYSKTYTWAGTAKGTDGKTAPISGSFTTVTPTRTVDASLNVGDGKTYGVAMPIAITFDRDVTDKAGVQKMLTVNTSVPVEGSWAWLSDRQVHWRPKDYWPPNTQVSLVAKLYGTSLGDGRYGAEDRTANFTIGRSQVVRANTQTHRLQVFVNNQMTADFPASFGLESDPGRVTNSGTHVVMSKHDTYSMSNPKYHYENVVVPWAVRISNNGEFIHGYAPSIPDQGKRNVSHGCANLSPANAKIYFDSAMTGDPVEIAGSTNQLGPEDGDYYDWAVPWDQWLAKSA
ncbi:L,D-transpeptidase [Actinophytocola oryzae]|uniref:Lipoprotein-anchoring transpeptidase ErfK/SrfK n=1 Tax=Actinophytocola oryzae TaxID=502181 RepID=A0A4V3FSB9_9PSEU|nr:Ig-like domain-containing protein [Actinophytocola oryzae]TDV46871.1 lipoprotein-anchoring transpeptidase ErfK/SrfK [Actinophytocola oryzae]